MRLLRWLLRILLAPVWLALRLILFFLTFVLSLSTTLLGVASSLLGLMAVLVMLAGMVRDGLWLLVIAWLVSPLGIPLAAEWLLMRLAYFQACLSDWLY